MAKFRKVSTLKNKICIFIAGSMSSSEMRMNPRPPKTPAWSHGLMTSPLDDPSSCSDNASDNSDKLDNYCSSQPPATSNGVGGVNTPGCKSRKRKIIGNSGPSFVTSGNCNESTGNRAHGESGSTGQNHAQKDGSEIRSNQGTFGSFNRCMVDESIIEP